MMRVVLAREGAASAIDSTRDSASRCLRRARVQQQGVTELICVASIAADQLAATLPA